MSDYTIVEKYQQSKQASAIAIRPYFNPSKENMGLQNYGMALHDGVWHEENLACLEINGVKRYVTGLNEFAPEVKMLPPAERDEKIKEIRSVISQLEKDLAANVVEPDDKEFWNKLTLLKPDNDKFWSRISVRCGNDPVYLDPEKDPYDLIKIYAIKAGGFSIVAKSLRDAKQAANSPKFYLDTIEETISTRTEFTKLRNRALVELQKLYDKNATKLRYVAKIVDIDSVQYTKSISNDVVYENMDLFINGDGSESNKKRAVQQFIDAARSNMEDLKIRALVKDALFYRFITTKSSGWIETLDSNQKMGKRPEEVVAYLKNPENEEVLTSLLAKVEPYWDA